MSEGGVYDELAIHIADAGTGDGALKGDIGDGEGGGGARDHQDIGVVLLVRREDCGDDLDLVTHAFGKEGPQGPVRQTVGENGGVAGPAFASEKAAGNLARGVEPFLIIYCQGEEVDPLTRLGHAGGDEDH